MTAPCGISRVSPSLLRWGSRHGQTVETLGQRDLAPETAVRPPLRSRGVEHRVLVFLNGIEPAEPGLVHIDVAGRALARSAAFRDDPVYAVLDGPFHDGIADGNGDTMGLARVRNVGDGNFL